MFSHFTLGSNDLKRSQQFYEPVLLALGLSRIETGIEDVLTMYSHPDQRHPHLFVCSPLDGLPATWSNGFHLAFNAKTTDAVDAFYAAAMEHGGYDEGAPGLRKHYAPDYYAAYVRDPDGNKLQAVCYTAGRSSDQAGEILSHITLGHQSLAREQKFYQGVLSSLGYSEIPEEGDFESAGFGIDGYELPVTYIQPAFDGRTATWGNGTHVAFLAPTRQSVDAFHRAALANDGKCCGAPGLRPQYSENYYAAYVYDPAGNKIQAVCRNPG